MKIAAMMATLNRPDYLLKTLGSLKDSGFFEQCNDFYVMDAGSDEDTLKILSDWQKQYKFEVVKSNQIVKYHEQFPRMWKLGMEKGYDYILFLESDIIVAKNFYQYILELMPMVDTGGIYGFYNVDHIHGKIQSNIPVLQLAGDRCFYGTCMVLFGINTIMPCYETAMTGYPYDIAIAATYGWVCSHGEPTHPNLRVGVAYPEAVVRDARLYTHFPSLCQHTGSNSLITGKNSERPEHLSDCFAGENFNCMELIYDTRCHAQPKSS